MHFRLPLFPCIWGAVHVKVVCGLTPVSPEQAVDSDWQSELEINLKSERISAVRSLSADGP